MSCSGNRHPQTKRRFHTHFICGIRLDQKSQSGTELLNNAWIAHIFKAPTSSKNCFLSERRICSAKEFHSCWYVLCIWSYLGGINRVWFLKHVIIRVVWNKGQSNCIQLTHFIFTETTVLTFIPAENVILWSRIPETFHF